MPHRATFTDSIPICIGQTPDLRRGGNEYVVSDTKDPLGKCQLLGDNLSRIEESIAIGVEQSYDPVRLVLELFLDRLLDPCRLRDDKISILIPGSNDRPSRQVFGGNSLE